MGTGDLYIGRSLYKNVLPCRCNTAQHVHSDSGTSQVTKFQLGFTVTHATYSVGYGLYKGIMHNNIFNSVTGYRYVRT